MVESAGLRTPSVQVFIGHGRSGVRAVATHEQRMDPSGMVYIGCAYPALPAYRCGLPSYVALYRGGAQLPCCTAITYYDYPHIAVFS